MSDDNSVMRFIQPALMAICVAGISFVAGAIYQHEKELLGLHRDISKIHTTIYRYEKRDLEYRLRFTTRLIELIKLAHPVDGTITNVQQARIKYYLNHREEIREEMADFIEENKHRGE